LSTDCAFPTPAPTPAPTLSPIDTILLSRRNVSTV
jgi:hypothetical protein